MVEVEADFFPFDVLKSHFDDGVGASRTSPDLICGMKRRRMKRKVVGKTSMGQGESGGNCCGTHVYQGKRVKCDGRVEMAATNRARYRRELSLSYIVFVVIHFGRARTSLISRPGLFPYDLVHALSVRNIRNKFDYL